MFLRKRHPAEEAAEIPETSQPEIPEYPKKSVEMPPENISQQELTPPSVAPPEPFVASSAPVPEYAPLFVKVEKYREILNTINEMKAFINLAKHIFAVMVDADGIRSDALRQLSISMARIERSISEFDAELLKPAGLESYPRGEVEVHHMEDSLAKLSDQISSLRKELEGYKK